MRAMYVPWETAMRDGDRVLDDLRRWTQIDTIMLLDLFAVRADGSGPAAPYLDSRVALPPGTKFDVPVRTMTEERFADLLRFMRSARSKGFRIASLAAPLFVCGGEPSMACVDFSGRRVRVREKTIFYGCPNNPRVVEYGRTFVRSLAESWPDLEMVSLDHLEYPINVFVSYPKADLRDLLVCFCDSCSERAVAEGFDLEAARDDVRALHRAATTRRPRSRGAPLDAADMLRFLVARPHLTGWLRFRMDSMTGYARSVVEAYRGATSKGGRRLGFYFQQPTLCNLVGTDYESLRSLFDYACVKLPDYLPGSILPMVAEQVARRTRAYDASSLLSWMRGLLDIGPGPDRYEPLGGMKDVLLYSNATDPTMVDRQMRHLSGFLSKGGEVLPHVWEHNGDVASLRLKMRALKKYGLGGYTVWAFEDGLSRENIRAARGVI
jgi:hypothetical protein